MRGDKMKIKISKSQWEMLGKKAGWNKVAGSYFDKNKNNPEQEASNNARHAEINAKREAINTKIQTLPGFSKIFNYALTGTSAPIPSILWGQNEGFKGKPYNGATAIEIWNNFLEKEVSKFPHRDNYTDELHNQIIALLKEYFDKKEELFPTKKAPEAAPQTPVAPTQAQPAVAKSTKSIKLSKSQWEMMGKKAGWMKKAAEDSSEERAIFRKNNPNTCYFCKKEPINKSVPGNGLCEKCVADKEANQELHNQLHGFNI